jgi:hypothetical protein
MKGVKVVFKVEGVSGLQVHRSKVEIAKLDQRGFVR